MERFFANETRRIQSRNFVAAVVVMPFQDLRRENRPYLLAASNTKTYEAQPRLSSVSTATSDFRATLYEVRTMQRVTSCAFSGEGNHGKGPGNAAKEQ
jgi:hypothetical protein